MVVWRHTEIWDPKSVVLTKRKSSGAFSQVYIGKKDKERYAIKIFNDFYTNQTYNPFDVDDLPSCVSEENALMNMPEHPNIIQLVGKYVKGNSIHFAYELGKKSMHAYDPPNPLPLIQQILRGLRHCHLHNIIHLDLKPDNIIMMDDDNVKIADFGHASIVPEVYDFYPIPFDKTTLWYRSPEQLFRISFSGYSDIWSMGCIIYELYTGEYFCITDNEMQMVTKLFQIYGTENIPEEYIKSAVAPKVAPKYPKQNWLGYRRNKIPSEYREILLQMLHPDPKKRPDIYQVCSVFEVDGPPPPLFLRRHHSCPDPIDTTQISKIPIIMNIVDFITQNYGDDAIVAIERTDPEDAVYMDIIEYVEGCESINIEQRQGGPYVEYKVGEFDPPYPVFMFIKRPEFINHGEDFRCVGYKIDPEVFVKIIQTSIVYYNN